MKQRLIFAFLFILTLGWLATIFSFSAQSGAESGGMSALIARPITNTLIRMSDKLTSKDWIPVYQKVDSAVRTAAHFTEYAVLGVLLTLLCHSKRLKLIWIPILIGTIYAITDEWHQAFTPGRTSDIRDVLVDSLGVLTGAVITRLLIIQWRKKHVQDSGNV